MTVCMPKLPAVSRNFAERSYSPVLLYRNPYYFLTDYLFDKSIYFRIVYEFLVRFTVLCIEIASPCGRITCLFKGFVSRPDHSRFLKNLNILIPQALQRVHVERVLEQPVSILFKERIECLSIAKQMIASFHLAHFQDLSNLGNLQ
jgi:hypothetical protein